MSCPACFKGSIHTHAEPAGKITTVHGLKCYVAAHTNTSEYDTKVASTASAHFNVTVQDTTKPEKKSTIIYCPDAFGLKLVNNLLLADLLCTKTGCRVLIPDILYRQGLDPWIMDSMESVEEPLLRGKYDVLGILYKIWTVLTILPFAIPFLIFGRPTTLYPKYKPWFDAVKEETTAQNGKLGVVGYCWGGGMGVILASKTWKSPDTKFVDALFTAHPSFVEPHHAIDTITKYKTPTSIAVAENDMNFTQKKSEQTEAKLREITDKQNLKGLEYEFKLYKGCEHSFAVRAKNNDFSMKGYYAAAKQAVDWFNRFLN